VADDIFTGETTPTDSFLEKYVGEGKKFKDVEALAKAYENADTHIPRLEGDLRDTREFIASKLDEIAQRQSQTPIGQTDETRSNPTPAPVTPPNAGGEDLDTRIKKILEQTSAESKAKNNAEFAQDILVERHGSVEAAIEAVQAKARELGVAPSYLRDMAHQSPSALFGLMGIDPAVKPTSRTTPAPSSDVNPQALSASNPGVKPGTYGYYEQLRKSDPKKYWSPSTQLEIMRKAQENPEFFN